MNRLAKATSPYLRQHADDPVDWYPWGEEAFRKAREEDKPILLSIGYAACHWCHVMQHESFQDPETARLMNTLFVNVKVDREERPDVDAIYMQAVQQLTGRGGWPLTVFLTPEGVPFYGGTYFPATPRYGMPAFRQVLVAVAEAYRHRRQEIEVNARQLIPRLQGSIPPSPARDGLTPRLLEDAYLRITREYDPVHGGFSKAPKFPPAMTLEFLMRIYHRFEWEPARQMVERTLQKMARGGIYDQIGGGFHRYSVDAYWLVPHFEKMLYDNALLSRAYLHAYQLTGFPLYRRIAEETLDYVRREMTAPHGGFYTSQDADSEGEEGRFYLWTPEEVRAVLGEEQGELLCRYYGITEAGNFEGRNVLHVPTDPDVLAEQVGLSLEALEAQVAEGRARLYEARAKRVWPARDEKVLVNGNGLMITAMAEAALVLGREDDLRAAQAAAGFILERMRRADGRLFHVYAGGEASVPGYLDDYAHLIAGLLALHQADGDLRWLREAGALAEVMLDRFWDDGLGGFYDTEPEHEPLLVRPRTLTDSATPAGNSMAVDGLLRLAVYFDRPDYRERAERVLTDLSRPMKRHPLAFPHLLCALDFALATPQEVALLGDPRREDTQAMLAVLTRPFRPHLILVRSASSEGADDLPLLQGRQPLDGRATAYVCQQFVCQAPTTDPDELARQLAS